MTSGHGENRATKIATAPAGEVMKIEISPREIMDLTYLTSF